MRKWGYVCMKLHRKRRSSWHKVVSVYFISYGFALIVLVPRITKLWCCLHCSSHCSRSPGYFFIVTSSIHLSFSILCETCTLMTAEKKQMNVHGKSQELYYPWEKLNKLDRNGEIQSKVEEEEWTFERQSSAIRTKGAKMNLNKLKS